MARHGRTFPIRAHLNYQGRIGIYFNKGFSLLSELGTFVLTGFVVTLKLELRLLASVGTFVLTGFASGLGVGILILMSLGTFVLTGQTTALTIARAFLSAVGTFILTGQAAIFNRAVIMVSAVGLYTLTGQIAQLLYNGLSIHWFPRTKNENTAYVNATKHTSTWVDKIKNE